VRERRFQDGGSGRKDEKRRFVRPLGMGQHRVVEGSAVSLKEKTLRGSAS